MKRVVAVLVAALLAALSTVQAQSVIQVNWDQAPSLKLSVDRGVNLNFTFSVPQHNVFVAENKANFDSCIGIELCSDTPCEVPLQEFTDPKLYLFCSIHCNSGFKTIVNVTEVSATMSPTKTPVAVVTKSPTIATHSPTTFGKQYVASDFVMTLPVAAVFCAGLTIQGSPGRLASIRSMVELARVPFTDQYYFLGGSRNLTTNETFWQDGTSLNSFPTWAQGHPITGLTRLGLSTTKQLVTLAESSAYFALCESSTFVTGSTLAPTTKTAFPSRSPTRKPTRRPTGTGKTASPVSIGPSEETEKLAVYIQMDYSGSIRDANKMCYKSTKKSCWDLSVDFVERLIGNITEQLGGWYDENNKSRLRVYLSAFTCNPNTGDSVNKVATVPSVAAYPDQVSRAIQFLRNRPEVGMYNTCPSSGAQEIAKWMALNKLPAVYYIITDGRITYPDSVTYRNTMTRIRAQVKKFNVRRDICAMTVGDIGLVGALQKLMGSSCIQSVSNFTGLDDKASMVARMMIKGPLADNETDSPSFEYENGLTDPPTLQPSSDSPSSDSSISKESVAGRETNITNVVIGAGSAGMLVAIAFGVIMMRRKAHREAAKRASFVLASTASPSAVVAYTGRQRGE